jgi:hypothetical protein
MPLWRNENCNGLADGSRPRHLLGSFSRPSPVFSVVFQRPGQCDGLPAHYYAKAEPPAVTPMQRLEAADRFFALPPAGRHDRDRARVPQLPPLAGTAVVSGAAI